ncbi:MAG TPA: hypothetical protein PKA05_18815 [Roseiflexaceae bacterium]|nr:hypothetical protein [Roseiflexaceae bacterium]
MITLQLADQQGLAAAQAAVAKFHYLQAPVDSRCSPVAYLIVLNEARVVGCLIFGRPEATRCYDGGLTYGSLRDVQTGRAQFDRWEILNLARVWLDPRVQQGGQWHRSDYLPGYTDRRGVWRSALASWSIEQALTRIGYDYLQLRPPVFPDEPYEIRAVLSYCDTRRHKGTIYRAAGFQLARANERGIETWYSTAVSPLTAYEHDQIRKAAWKSPRGIRLRAQRQAAQQELSL